MSRWRKERERNGDIYCSLRVESLQALKKLQKLLRKNHFIHTQILPTESLDNSLLEKLDCKIWLEFLLVLTKEQFLYQYVVHLMNEPAKEAYLFTEKHSMYIDPAYIEFFTEPDNLPPYSTIQILA